MQVLSCFAFPAAPTCRLRPERENPKQNNIGVSQNLRYPIWGLHNKDYNILGSILGSPYLGKLPYDVERPEKGWNPKSETPSSKHATSPHPEY